MNVVKKSKSGAILILIMLISTVTILISTTLLSAAVMNYKMKKLNSKVKHVFYTSESVMEEAYLVSVGFVEDALIYADGKDEEHFKEAYVNFIQGKCNDLASSKSIAAVVKDKSKYIVYKDDCYKIDAKLTAKSDLFQLDITSIYSENNIDKQLKLICRLNTLKDNSKDSLINIKAEDLIHIIDWKVER